jgi:hypothetical protein
MVDGHIPGRPGFAAAALLAVATVAVFALALGAMDGSVLVDPEDSAGAVSGGADTGAVVVAVSGPDPVTVTYETPDGTRGSIRPCPIRRQGGRTSTVRLSRRRWRPSRADLTRASFRSVPASSSGI